MDFVQFINDNWDAPTEKKAAMLDDFCEHYSYQETVPNPEGGELIPNPVSKKEFVNKMVVGYIVGIVNATRRKVAEKLAEYEELTFE